MKISFYHIILFFIISCAPQSQSDIEELKVHYELVFEDNFKGEFVDTIKWSTISSNPKPFDRILPRGNCNFENAALLSNTNVVVENDFLNLIVKQEEVIYRGVAGGDDNTNIGCDLKGNRAFQFNQKYTSGSIFSKKGFDHGLFECRAKIPSAKGLYPVFWLWHHDEIVVFEFFGDSNSHFVSSHNKEKYVTKEFNKYDYSADFHDYAVNWTSDQITWFLDGKSIWSIDRDNSNLSFINKMTANKPDNKDFNIEESFPDSVDRWLSPNISLRLYEWAENIENQKLPDTLIIDYVKIYQKPSK